MSKPYVPARIKKHWQKVAELHCLVCGMPAQIAHMHGPSLQERNPRYLKPKGKKQIWQHWLVVGLCEPHHWLQDNRPHDFEQSHGTCAEYLDQVCVLTGVDVWAASLAEMRQRVAA